SLTVLWMTLGASTLPPLNAAAEEGRSVTTLRYNNARTGWNQYETVLNIDNVNPATFGKLWAKPLDGGRIYTAPLYVSGVMIKGEARSVVYVATETNLVYALDADTGAEVWPEPYLLGSPLPMAGQGRPCASVGPILGITGTPVIDEKTGTL